MKVTSSKKDKSQIQYLFSEQTIVPGSKIYADAVKPATKSEYLMAEYLERKYSISSIIMLIKDIKIQNLLRQSLKKIKNAFLYRTKIQTQKC